MKHFLALVCSILLVASASAASSPYAGKYYAVSFDASGNVVAAANIKVKKNGRIKGHSLYINFTSAVEKGQVDASGHFTVNENGSLAYSGTISSDGQHFTAQLSTGNVVKGTRVPDNFPEAGVYAAETDDGLPGIFIVTNTGTLLGGIYDPSEDEVYAVRGLASPDGFSGSTDSGVDFDGTFDGSAVSGTYSDGDDFEGTFSGQKL